MKTAKVIVLLIVSSVLTLAAFADDFNPLVYQYHNPEVTVEFANVLNITAERQQQIADDIAGVNSSSVPISSAKNGAQVA